MPLSQIGMVQSFGGLFKDLVLSATGKSASVSIAADSVVLQNGSGSPLCVSDVSLTLNTAGSGANGLDTGSLVVSTWYAVWVISNGVTTAALASLSGTAPTMPSGYIYKARIGWIRTDGTANKYPLGFNQCGRVVQYMVASGSNVAALPTMASGAAGSVTAPTWVAVGVSNFVPSTAGRIGVLLTGTYNVTAMVAPNSSYGAVSSGSISPPFVIDFTKGPFNAFGWMNLESTNIYWASSFSSCGLYAFGWEDNF